MTQTYKDTDAKGKSAAVVFGNPTDAAGNQVSVKDGSVKFGSSNDGVATVTQDPTNPMAASVSFTGKNGSADIVISANADLVDGGTDDEITGLVTFVVETTEATGFGDPSIAPLA